jgi:hypothetical protein
MAALASVSPTALDQRRAAVILGIVAIALVIRFALRVSRKVPSG